MSSLLRQDYTNTLYNTIARWLFCVIMMMVFEYTAFTSTTAIFVMTRDKYLFHPFSSLMYWLLLEELQFVYVVNMASEISYSKVLERKNCLKAKETDSVEPKKSFPLHSAVEYKNLHKIKILLNVKDINEKNEKGNTVLHIICDQYLDNLEVLALLLSCDDIDVSLKTSDGFSALHCLAYRGNLPGIIELLKRFPSLSVDVETEKQDTALIIATRMNYIDIVQYLLSQAACVNHANDKKCTALHYAANNGYVKCTKILLNNGADIDVVDNYGLTPLLKSCKWGYMETCEVLLRNGANIHYVSPLGITALTSSCYNDSSELTKLLILFGADINYPGNYSAALMECVKKDSLCCAMVLLERGVNVKFSKNKRKAAHRYANRNGSKKVLELLKPHF